MLALLGNGCVVFVLVLSRSKMDVPRFVFIVLLIIFILVRASLKKKILFDQKHIIKILVLFFQTFPKMIFLSKFFGQKVYLRCFITFGNF